MEKNINLTEAFNIRDQYCCLQLLTGMVTEGNLKDSTSSIYEYMEEIPDLQNILLNIFYIPNSVMNYSESNVLSQLIIDTAKSSTTTASYLTAEQVAASKAIMSDAYARELVVASGDVKAGEIVSTVIGQAAYRCVVSDLNTECDFSSVEFVLQRGLPDTNQSDSVTLAMLKIANNATLRATVQTTKDINVLSKTLQDINVGAGFDSINSETAQQLAELLIANDKEKLVNYIGQTMYQVTW